MTHQTWFDAEIAKIEDDLDFVTEAMTFDFVNEIRRVMKEKQITQTALASRIGKSRAYISKVLNYNPNMTIRSLAMIALALDVQLRWSRPRLINKGAIDRLDSLVIAASDFSNSLPQLEPNTITQKPVEAILPEAKPHRRKRTTKAGNLS